MEEDKFKQFVESIVEVKNPRWLREEDIKWKVALPTTNEEFKAFTKKYYGVELSAHVIIWGEGVSYRIRKRQDDYSQGELYKRWDKMFGQYAGLKVLLTSIFGELSCGGVAGSHYGQTRLEEKKRNLLLNWDEFDNEDKKREYLEEQKKSLVEIFGGEL